MRIWIDLANAPHVRLFEPVHEELRERGHELLLTVRDHRETATLARRIWPDVEPDGGSSPNQRFRKGTALLARASALRTRARGFRPDVAVSHNSYAQIVAARLIDVPAVTAMDYEHQPANHLAFRLATRVVVPRVFPEESLRRFGAGRQKVRRYEGFKEELYLRRAAPNGERSRLGVPGTATLAVLRLPPDGALYHRGGNSLVDEVVAALVQQDAWIVLLPRSDEQRAAWRNRERDGLLLADPPINSEALLAETDLFVGAGGTMTREAAVLGIPTYSIFAGRTPAVDRALESEGRLTIVRSPEMVRDIRAEKRLGPPSPAPVRADGIARVLLSSIEQAGAR
jgi:uncharacterized protein